MFAMSLRTAWVLLPLCGVSAVWADCVDTVRLSAKEQEFFRKANAALVTFLRPPPEGQNIRFSDSVGDPAGAETCKRDYRLGNFTPSVSRKFIWPDPQNRRADAVVTLTLTVNVDKFSSVSPQGRPPGHTGHVGEPSPQRSAALAVQNVEWVLTEAGFGDAAQTDQLRRSVQDALDTERLGRLVGAALPPVRQSEALLQKPAAAFTLAAPATPPVAAAVTAPKTEAAVATSAEPVPAANAPSTDKPAVPAAVPGVDAARNALGTLQNLKGLFGR